MRLCLVSAVLAEEPVLQGSLKNRFLWGLPTQTGFARLPKTVFVRMVIQKPVFEIPEKPVLLGCHTKSRFCQAPKTPGLARHPPSKSLVWWGLPGGPAWQPPRRRASWRWRSRPARLFCRSCWSPWAASPRSPDTTTTNQLINQSTWWVRNQSSNNYSDPSKIR